MAIKNHVFNIMFQKFNDMENFYNKMLNEKVEHQFEYIVRAHLFFFFFFKDIILVSEENESSQQTGCPPPRG